MGFARCLLASAALWTICGTLWPLGTAAATTLDAVGEVALPEPTAAREAFDAAVAAFKSKRFDEVDRQARLAYLRGYGAEAVELLAVAALSRTKVSLAHVCYGALVDEPTTPAGIRTRAEKQLAALAAQGAEHTLEVAPAGAEIAVDGERIGRAPLRRAILAMPGTHRILSLIHI